MFSKALYLQEDPATGNSFCESGNFSPALSRWGSYASLVLVDSIGMLVWLFLIGVAIFNLSAMRSRPSKWVRQILTTADRVLYVFMVCTLLFMTVDRAFQTLGFHGVILVLLVYSLGMRRSLGVVRSIDFTHCEDSWLYCIFRTLVVFTPLGIGYVWLQILGDVLPRKATCKVKRTRVHGQKLAYAIDLERRFKVRVSLSLFGLFKRLARYCATVCGYGLFAPIYFILDVYVWVAWTLIKPFFGEDIRYELQAEPSPNWVDYLSGKGVDADTRDMVMDVLMLSFALLKTQSVFDALNHVANFIVKRCRAGSIKVGTICEVLKNVTDNTQGAVKDLSRGLTILLGGALDFPKGALKKRPGVVGSAEFDYIAADDIIELQAGSVFMSRLKNIGNYPRIVGLVKLSSVLVAMMSLKSFDAANVFGALKSTEGTTYFKDVGDILKLILDTMKTIYDSVVGFSLEPFFNSDNPIAQWTNEVDLYVAKVKTIETAHDGNVAGDTLDSLLSLGDKLKARYDDLELMAKKTQAPQLVSSLRLKNVELLHYHSKVAVVMLRNAQRAAPFGLCLSGPSSIGKSCLVSILHAVNCSIFEPDCDPNSKIYTHTGATKYMDGLNQNVITFLMDDVGKENPNQVKECEDMNILIGVQNSVSYTPNMAKVEAKGNTILAPKALILSTNTEHMNARHFLSHPVAAWRRINFVARVEVNAPYRMEGTSRLDPEKVPVNDDNVWQFTVIRKIFKDDKEVIYDAIPEELVLRTSSKAEFVKWYKKTIVQHHQRENTRLTRVSNINMCHTCNLPDYMCDCGGIWAVPDDIEQQSFVGSVVADGQVSWYLHLACGFFLGSVLVKILVWVWHQRQRAIVYTRRVVVGLFLWTLRTYIRLQYQRRCRRAGVVLRDGIVAVRRNLKYVFVTMGALLAVYYVWRFFSSTDMQADTPELGVDDQVKANWVNCARVDESFATNGSIKTRRTQKLDLSSSTLRLHVLPIDPKTGQGVASNMFCVNGFIYKENRVVTVGHEFLRSPGHDFRIHMILKDSEATSFNLSWSRLFLAKDEFGYDLALFKAPLAQYHKDYLGTEKTTYFHSMDHKCLSEVQAFIGDTDKNWIIGEGQVTSYGIFQLNGGNSLFTRMFGNAQGSMPIFYGTWPEKKGYCGSPIITNGTGPVFSGYSGILGFHFAAQNDPIRGRVSLGIKTSYEMMKQMDDALSRLQEDPTAVDDETFQLQSVNLGDGHELGPIASRCASNFVEPHDVLAGTRLKRFNGIYQAGSLYYQGKDKTKVAPTGIATKLGSYLETEYGVTSDKVGPEMRKNGVFQNIIRSFSPISATYNDVILWLSQIIILRQLYDGLKSSRFYDCSSGKIRGFEALSEFEMVNGKGNQLPCVNMQTSAGYPFKGAKLKLAEEVPLESLPEGVDKSRRYYKFCDDVMVRYHNLWGRIKDNVALGTVYSTSLKDEAIRHTKFVEMRTRPIFGSPIDKTLLTRKLFGSFLLLIRNHKQLFRSAVGMNAESHDWDKLARQIEKFKFKVDGDYKNYDKAAYSYTSMCRAFEMCILLSVKFGRFTQDEVKAMMALKQDMLAPFIEFFGTLFMGAHAMPSGDPWTTDMNCIHNWLVTTYVLLVTLFERSEVFGVYETLKSVFRDLMVGVDHGSRLPCGLELVSLPGLCNTPYVELRRLYAIDQVVENHYDTYSKLMTVVDDNFSVFYGDDNIICSNDERVDFPAIQRAFAICNVVYTPAEKHLTTYSSKETPDLTFLKRRFIYDDEWKVYKAPLEPEVLHKILLVKLYKKQSREAADLEAISVCWRYACNYDRATCEWWHNMLKDIAQRMGYVHMVDFEKLPTYDQRMIECYESEDGRPSEMMAAAFFLDHFGSINPDDLYLEIDELEE